MSCAKLRPLSGSAAAVEPVMTSPTTPFSVCRIGFTPTTSMTSLTDADLELQVHARGLPDLEGDRVGDDRLEALRFGAHRVRAHGQAL